MSGVLLRYDSGHPTLLPSSARLAATIRALGPPVKIHRFGFAHVFEWAPLYPDAPEPPAYRLADPFPDKSSRRIVSVELAP